MQAPQSVPTTPTPSPAQSATPATSSSPQPPTPSLTARAERASHDIVSAPSPASTPLALEMPVRAPIAPSGQTAESPQPPAPPLGPFQPFQTSQPAQPAPQARPAQQVQQPQEPPAERAVQLQPAQAPQESQPLGPFEPFQPDRSLVAERARPATESVPTSPQSATPATPSVEELPSEASSPISTSPPTQVPVAARSEQVAQAPAGEEVPVVHEVVRETPVPSRESEPRGFLGSVFDRLFARGERTKTEEQGERTKTEEQGEPRTPAIQMPWVRQGRLPQSQPDETRSTSTDDVELPSTRVAEPGRQASREVAAVPTPSTPATPSLASASPPPPQQAPQPISEQTAPIAQPVEPPPSQATMPVQAEVEAESAPPVSVGGQASASAAQQMFESPQVGQVPGDMVDYPDLPRVLEMDSTPSQPSPLDMPHAAQTIQTDLHVTNESADDLIQMATLPSQAVVRPTIEMPTEAPPPPVPEPVLAPTAPEAAQVRSTEPEAPQVWTLMPDVANSLVRSHAPSLYGTTNRDRRPERPAGAHTRQPRPRNRRSCCF